MKFILITVLCGLVHLTYGQNCEKCLTTNDAYCVNENSYYFCMDGNPLTATLHTCKDDYICTGSENICEPKVNTDGNANVPACVTSCNKCPDAAAVNKRYTCVSKTNYARCVNGNVTVASPCEDNTLCNSELYAATGKICAPTCVIDFFGFSNTCSNDDTTTSTTPAPSTTPSVQNIKDQCNDAQIVNNKYFYIRNINDAECTTYIYCELVEGEMEALLIKCSNGYYFDSTTSKCVATKPTNCGVAAPATTTTIIPATNIPTVIPDTTTTTIIPATNIPTVIPDTTTTTIIPSTDIPTVIPDTTTTTIITDTTTTLNPNDIDVL